MRSVVAWGVFVLALWWTGATVAAYRWTERSIEEAVGRALKESEARYREALAMGASPPLDSLLMDIRRSILAGTRRSRSPVHEDNVTVRVDGGVCMASVKWLFPLINYRGYSLTVPRSFEGRLALSCRSLVALSGWRIRSAKSLVWTKVQWTNVLKNGNLSVLNLERDRSRVDRRNDTDCRSPLMNTSVSGGHYGCGPSTLHRRADQRGMSLLEVLVAALVAGVGIIGIALMLSYRSVWVEAMGEDRVSVGIAQQKIECLIAKGFNNVKEGSPGAVVAYNEPPWEAEQTPATPDARCAPPLAAPVGAIVQLASKPFVRLTCVQYVLASDNQFGTGGTALYSPAYTGDVASNSPCDPFVDIASSPPTSCATLGASCVDSYLDANGQTRPLPKRITVVVTADSANAQRRSDRLPLQAWLMP